MNLALNYRSDGHLCKQGPSKVAEFYMEASHATNIFRGFLLTEMHIVKHLPSPSSENPHVNLQQTFTEETLVEIKGHENLESVPSTSHSVAKVTVN